MSVIERLKAETAADTIRRARALIEDEGAHIQHEMALDERGNSVSAIADCAVKFCALGALVHASRPAAGASPMHRYTWARARAQTLIAAYFPASTSGLTSCNDGREDGVDPHTGVLAMYDAAIAKAERVAAA